MLHQESPIAEPLRPYINVIWSMESDLCVPPMRILPDRCVELVIHFDRPYKTTFSNGETALQPQSFIVAQMKNLIEIEPHGKIGFISQGAYHFVGSPMKEIANGITDLKLLWNDRAGKIEERISECANAQQRIHRIQDYLLT